jgi:DNA polymerase V
MKHGGARKGAGRPRGTPTKPIRLPTNLIDSVLEYVKHNGYQLPLFGSKVSAGGPSPADDYVEDKVDLNSYLVKHPEDTFLVRATGKSMIDAGIQENDLLIVDRNIKPSNGKIVIAAVDGQLTVKRLDKTTDGKLALIPANPDFKPIPINDNSEVHIWGVVTNVIHAV